MKKLTVDDVMDLGPCEAWTRERVSAELGEPATIREILDLERVPAADRVWLALQPGVLPPAVADAAVEKIVTRAVRTYALPHPATAEWASKWLDGSDRSRRSALAADAVAVAAAEAEEATVEAAVGAVESAEAAAWAATAATRAAAEGAAEAALGAVEAAVGAAATRAAAEAAAWAAENQRQIQDIRDAIDEMEGK